MTNLHSMPGRESDAGPDNSKAPFFSGINRQSLYSLLVDEALEGVRDLGRLYLDDRKAEQRRRIEIITSAMTTLEKLKEVV